MQDVVDAGDDTQRGDAVDRADDLSLGVDDSDRLHAAGEVGEDVAHPRAGRHTGGEAVDRRCVDRRHHRVDRQDLRTRDVAHERPHVVVGWGSDDLGGRTDLHEAPVAHHGDAVAEAQRLDEVVRDEHHRRRQLSAQADDLVLHVTTDHRVECGERFVEEEHLRPGGQGTGQSDALLHATRELVGAGAPEPRQPDQLEEVLGSRPAHVLAHALHFQPEGHVVDEITVGEQAEVLEHHAHAMAAQVEQLAFVGGRDVEAADPHRSGRRLDEAGQAADERGLPAPGQAHDDEHLAVGDVEIDLADRDHVAGLGLQLAS